MNLKENSDFLDNFRQILSEANVDEFVGGSGQGSPTDQDDLLDYNEDTQMEFSPNIKSANSFISQIQMEK
jgi:hypothetical protein